VVFHRVLEPILFVIYINDIDENVSGRILKFADDTKIYHKVHTDEPINSLRRDLCGNRGNWNFRTKELLFPGTKVVPMTDIKGELSFPNIGYYCLVMILKGNLNS